MSDLSFYSGTPFTPNNQVDLVDLFTSSGATATYYLTNKTLPELGSTIQAGGIQYYEFNGGFTTNPASASFTLATIPPVNTQIVAPGVNQLIAAAFDQPVVVGISNPTVATIPVWLIDPSTINNYVYNPLPTYSGIQLSVVQMISGSSSQPNWYSFASADASGNSMSYGASGAPLYLPAISAVTRLVGTVTGSQSVLTTQAASSFMPGSYISINIGASSQEILHVIAVQGNDLVLDPTGVTYPHYNGELIFHCGWKFFMKLVIPDNANNNTPVNLYNLGLQRLGAIKARP